MTSATGSSGSRTSSGSTHTHRHRSRAAEAAGITRPPCNGGGRPGRGRRIVDPRSSGRLSATSTAEASLTCNSASDMSESSAASRRPAAARPLVHGGDLAPAGAAAVDHHAPAWSRTWEHLEEPATPRYDAIPCCVSLSYWPCCSTCSPRRTPTGFDAPKAVGKTRPCCTAETEPAMNGWYLAALAANVSRCCSMLPGAVRLAPRLTCRARRCRPNGPVSVSIRADLYSLPLDVAGRGELGAGRRPWSATAA